MSPANSATFARETAGDPRKGGRGFPVDLPLRCVFVAAQAATVLLTWRVWEPRSHPPMLPLLDLPAVHAGWPMLASLAVVLGWPRVGVPLHTLVLGLAIVADQSRMQPHVVSLATLLWAASGLPDGRVVARAALAALWTYAGLHKLTSATYFTVSGAWLLRAVWPAGPTWIGPTLAAAVAGTELFLGLACFVPRLRTTAAMVAPAFHLATFAVLAFRLQWDAAVWPWNLALAAAGPGLLIAWQGAGLGAEFALARRPARRVAVALLLLPAGYWLGVVDAFLAHCVYADNRPKASVCTPFSRTDLEDVCRGLGVVLPPAHRLYAPFFRGIGRPGEWLEIEDPRWIAHVRGFARRKLRWDDLAAPAVLGKAAAAQ
ncbi:MAG: hypothetical protein LW698_04415 [Planctomycetaceae bacterium]|jgi:hypothetical protein|nr:hypothetical protein [Planctomycetaceae bacterium]